MGPTLRSLLDEILDPGTPPPNTADEAESLFQVTSTENLEKIRDGLRAGKPQMIPAHQVELDAILERCERVLASR